MANSRWKKITKLGEEVMSNEDLLLEVLLRLPAKSLIKFKCVSKHWLSLISDPIFGSRHTRLNPSPLTLGIYLYSGLRSVSLDQKNLPSLAFINSASPGIHSGPPKIMHACNGLILCCYRYGRPYFICNMTTQKTTILPDLPSKKCFLKWYPGDYCAYLVTDPSKSPHFKVVLLNMALMNMKHTTFVYSSETGVWRSFLSRALHGSPLNFKAVCDGSLHWITKEKFHVRFEVDTLKFVSNPLPSKPTTMDVKKIRYFGECCGRLFLIHVPWRSAKPFHVFELDKDHSTWKLKYSVNFSLLMAAYPDSFKYIGRCWKFVILRLVKEDDINGFSVILAIPRKIVSYNLRKNTFKVLEELPMGVFPWENTFEVLATNNLRKSQRYYFTETFPFMSTLFPV